MLTISATEEQVGITLSKWFALISIALMMMIVNIDYTSINLALYSIAIDFKSDLANIQWIISGYTTAWAAFVIIGGKLCDIFPKKAIFNIGLALFLLASWLSSITDNANLLIFFRALQGISTGIFYPAAVC